MRYALSIRIIFSVVLFTFSCKPCFAAVSSEEPKQRFIQSELTLLAPEALYATLFDDIASMNSWTNIMLGLIEETAQEKSPQTASIFQIILSADAPLLVEEVSEPQLNPDLSQEYRNLILSITPPKLKFGKLAFRISIRPRSISSRVLQNLHNELLPYLANDLEDFRRLSLGEKIAYLSHWSRDQAIPAITQYAKLQFPKLQGINNLTSFFEKHDDTSFIPIASYSETNPLFWRAVFEMPADEPLASTLELFAHVANRNFAYAKRLLNVTLPFSSIQKPSGFYLDQLASFMQIMQEDIQKNLNEIRSLVKAEKYDDAIFLCENILTAMPGHPLFLHEYIKSNLDKRKANGEAVSLKDFMSRDLINEIYKKDPFFLGSVVLRSARDAYNHVQRNRIDEIFKDTQNYRNNLAELAQNCLNLRAWHFAAHLFHRCLYYTETDEQGKNKIINFFLYALEKSNVQDFKSNFPGDHASTFADIEQILNQRFKQSEAYRGFNHLKTENFNK